jgi:hypothetical protein
MTHKQRGNLVQQVAGPLLAWLATIFVLICALAPGVTAAAISQGYQADQALAAGSLVSVKDGQNGRAQATDVNNSNYLLGVVVGDKDANLAVSTPSDRFQVATTGVVTAFVSNLNGDIKAGDPIGASPIAGVGMKATEAGKIVGVAQEDAKATSRTVEVKSKDGSTKTAIIDTVNVVVQVAYYNPPVPKTAVPTFLQLFVNQIAGKQVSLVRLVASAVIVVGAVIIIGVLLYSAVRSTMVSIGRNPLAQSSIYRGLWQVVVSSLLILVAAMGAAFLVLTR